MYRLATAELNGSLGLSRRPKEGVKWLKRSAEHATPEFPHALHELALLHERGIENVLFVDLEYASELLAQAAELGYAPSAFRLGECYEYGKMGCPMDAALSIHYYVSFSLKGLRVATLNSPEGETIRTSPHNKIIVKAVSLSRLGISWDHLAFYHNRTLRRSCGRKRQQRWD